jgi:hypothetical protein
MANTLLSPQDITHELLRRFLNNLGFCGGVHHEYDDRFAQSGGKIGDTLNARIPVRFGASDGSDIDIQDVEEITVPIRIDTQKHVAFQFTSKDLTLTIDEFGPRYLQSAAVALANAVDVDGLTMAMRSTYNFVGTPGTIPSAIKTYNQSGAWLDKMSAPMDGDRSVVITPDGQVEIVDALKALFHSTTQIKSQYLKGRMGIAAGFEWVMDQNVQTHVTGPFGGTPAVNGAGQSGTSIITDGWTAAAALRLRRNDVISFADVYAVNAVSKATLADLASFVVTQDVSSDGSGNATIPLEPEIILSGPRQNVSALPADGALINIFGKAQADHASIASTNSPQQIAYHKEAFGFAMVPMELPAGTDKAARSVDRETGVSIRTVRDYDIMKDRFITRCDILYGWAPLLPSFACRIVS